MSKAFFRFALCITERQDGPNASNQERLYLNLSNAVGEERPYQSGGHGKKIISPLRPPLLCVSCWTKLACK